MEPNEKIMEVSTQTNSVAEDIDKPKMPTNIIDFFREAPKVDLRIPTRTDNDEHRRVEFEIAEKKE